MSRYVPVEDRAYGDEVRAENRGRVVERERQAVDRYLEERCQDILTGQCSNTLSEHRIDQLFAAVKEGVSGNKLKIRHNYLVHRLQQAAREHNLDLPNQQRMLVLHGESAPATPAGFEELATSHGWVDGFWDDIENPLSRDGFDTEKLDAGRLLFSCIVFGGVHSRKKLELLVDAIPKGVWHLEELTWMDVETSTGLWRWFPDPVSTLLLQRWYKTYGVGHWPRANNTDAPRLIFHFLKFLNRLPEAETRPKVVFRKLIDASATRDATWLEGVFHHIQHTHGAIVSLPKEAWARLLTRQVAFQAHEIERYEGANPATALRPLTGRCDSDAFAGVGAIQAVLRQATRISEAGERDKTYQHLTAIAEDDSWAPIVRVLARWTAHLRRFGGQQKRLVISSIQRYLTTIANPLVSLLATTDDLNALGEDEWQELYDRLCSGASCRKRRADRAVVAGWFHEFLVEQFGMPEVEIEGATTNGETDANLLTPAEYVRAQSMLEHSDASTRLIKIQKLVLMLGFRCGLRRTEVQKILIKDVQGLMAPVSKRPELFTRGNKFAGQKSSSGTRRLPLWALLTKVELNQLADWYQYRLKEPNTTGSDLLFCAPQRGRELIPQRELFTPIQEAMRMASGTPSLRFHHLRHACVTLTGLRLFERRPGELMQEKWARDDSGNMAMPLEIWRCLTGGEICLRLPTGQQSGPLPEISYGFWPYWLATRPRARLCKAMPT
ncbi:site-specific integrase [Marinobacter sp. F4216]|uniref:site-specific integrase n=1 Tax=Marinobacter sp. F4216 TaxID=2874281 RepID=UPI001CBCDA38|nr:site-specific integrase [Marinobacter sp. F4216]MBZ2170257.1 site-specific integrase [Marinobacter sp. F4216]